MGSKSGFVSDAHQGQGDGSDIDTGGQQDTTDNYDNDKCAEGQNAGRDEAEQQDKDKNGPIKQFRSYYARILFYSFLTENQVASLEDIITTMEMGDNVRIAHNIGIHKPVLENMLTHMNKFALRDLDYKIFNINKLSQDTELPPIERASVAVQKIGKLGDSEVITPAHICSDMIDLLPDECLVALVGNGHKILDISSKVGEFAIALCKRYDELGYDIAEINNLICSIPTSSITYEFSRKVYEVLGLDITNIAEQFTAYDLLNVTTEDGAVDYSRIAGLLKQDKPFNSITLEDTPDGEGDETVIFDAVVGNPPYQEKTLGDANGAQAKPIYQLYVEGAYILSKRFVSIITPARWYSGGWGLDDFRNTMISCNHVTTLHDYPISLDCFDGVEIKGGVCHFLLDKDYSGTCQFIHHVGKQETMMDRYLKEEHCEVLIRFETLISIYRKVLNVEGNDFVPFSSIVSGRSPFGLNTNHHGHSERIENDIPYLESAGYTFIDESRIKRNSDVINKYKVYISKAYGAGEGWPHQIINKPLVGIPGDCCSGTYLLVGPFNTQIEAINVA